MLYRRVMKFPILLIFIFNGSHIPLHNHIHLNIDQVHRMLYQSKLITIATSFGEINRNEKYELV